MHEPEQLHLAQVRRGDPAAVARDRAREQIRLHPHLHVHDPLPAVAPVVRALERREPDLAGARAPREPPEREPRVAPAQHEPGRLRDLHGGRRAARVRHAPVVRVLERRDGARRERVDGCGVRGRQGAGAEDERHVEAARDQDGGRPGGRGRRGRAVGGREGRVRGPDREGADVVRVQPARAAVAPPAAGRGRARRRDLHVGELAHLLVDARRVHRPALLRERQRGRAHCSRIRTGPMARHSTSAPCARKLCSCVHVRASQNVTVPSESPDTIVPSLR